MLQYVAIVNTETAKQWKTVNRKQSVLRNSKPRTWRKELTCMAISICLEISCTCQIACITCAPTQSDASRRTSNESYVCKTNPHQSHKDIWNTVFYCNLHIPKCSDAWPIMTAPQGKTAWNGRKRHALSGFGAVNCLWAVTCKLGRHIW